MKSLFIKIKPFALTFIILALAAATPISILVAYWDYNSSINSIVARLSQLPQLSLVIYFSILFLVLTLTLLGIYFSFLKPKKSMTSLLTRSKEQLPKAYYDIFSQPIDPIGNLHIWYKKNAHRLISDEGGLSRVEYTNEQKILSEGISRVIYLQKFLSRHCELEVFGEYGNDVVFDPNLYAVDESVAGHVKYREGMNVKIFSPGWRWKEKVIRFPKVK